MFADPPEQLLKEAQQISYTREKKRTGEKPVRQVLPAHLPRVEEVIEPESLPEGAQKIGQEITEQLEYNPAQVFVRRIVRPKYALPQHQGVIIAELPTLALPKPMREPPCWHILQCQNL